MEGEQELSPSGHVQGEAVRCALSKKTVRPLPFIRIKNVCEVSFCSMFQPGSATPYWLPPS